VAVVWGCGRGVGVGVWCGVCGGLWGVWWGVGVVGVWCRGVVWGVALWGGVWVCGGVWGGGWWVVVCVWGGGLPLRSNIPRSALCATLDTYNFYLSNYTGRFIFKDNKD
jgi:hypothetical protein